MEDESSRAYQRLEQGAGRRVGIANAVGPLAAAAFLIAALVLLIAIQQGVDLRQLLIGGLTLLVLNLVLALVWTSMHRRGD
jgi:high-affinity Fe2+/Pb2+ permease